MNTRTWLHKWLKPANLIALATLFITGFGIFTGTKFLFNKQSVTTEDNCIVNTVTQETTNKGNSEQNVECSDKSKITGVTQKQTK